MSCYELVKDIIIPSSEVVATLYVGTFIANSLKNKEKNAKIKSLLIDSYMSYLACKSKFISREIDEINSQVLKDMYDNFTSYFLGHSNIHIPLGIIQKKRESLSNSLQTKPFEEANWSYFTFKFCFLLGKKNYDSHAQALEDKIVESFVGENVRSNFLNTIKPRIKEDKEIGKMMTSMNTADVGAALEKIELIIELSYNEFQRSVFNPYDTRIANMIDTY